MLGNAANTVPSIKDGLEKYGMAEGGRKMINEEMSAAQLAIRRGVYVTWRSKGKSRLRSSWAQVSLLLWA